jgi:hypothetical protein
LLRTRNRPCIRVETKELEFELVAARHQHVRSRIEQCPVAARRIENPKSGPDIDSTADSLREKARERRRRVMDAATFDPSSCGRLELLHHRRRMGH